MNIIQELRVKLLQDEMRRALLIAPDTKLFPRTKSTIIAAPARAEVQESSTQENQKKHKE